jgi:hypothetical protein
MVATTQSGERLVHSLMVCLGGLALVGGGLSWDLIRHASGVSDGHDSALLADPAHLLVAIGLTTVGIGGLRLGGEIARLWPERRRPVSAAMLLAGLPLAAVPVVLLLFVPVDHGAVLGGAADPRSSTAAQPQRGRLSVAEQAALVALSWSRPSTIDDGAKSHSHEPAGAPGPAVEIDAAFRAQWREAEATADRLRTVEAATAAGYVQATPPVPGVGAHWIRWSLIDRPFDPAAPSMLLFDEVTAGRGPELVGFSYWAFSEHEPVGFAGEGDVWHRHHGLCFVNGWLMEEDLVHREDCAGDWVNGRDLWMLHAWVVDAAPNPDGRFADVNPALCRTRPQTPDWLSCDPAGLGTGARGVASPR